MYWYALWLILRDSLYLSFGIIGVFIVLWVFLSLLRGFSTLIISVDLFFYFRLHIGFVWIDWLRLGCFHIVMIKVNLIASIAWLPSTGIRAKFAGLDEYSLIPVSKVFLTEVSGKRVPYKCVNDGTSGSLWGTRVWRGVYQWGRDSHLMGRL